MRTRLGILVVAVLGLLTGGSPPADAIIALGTSASAGTYPFMAVVFNNGSFTCSGTVVAPRWVLTAAHCIGPGAFTVRVGSTNKNGGGAVIAVDNAVAHPQYNSADFSNDAGLLHLVSDAQVTPVRLASGADNDLEADGAAATLVGWGDITPTGGLLAPAALRQGRVNIVGDDVCFGDPSAVEAQTNVCDAGLLQGQCNGDSGGAQLGQKYGGWVQIGIISHSVTLLCGYANQLVPEASAEVNAPSIRNFISGTAGV